MFPYFIHKSMRFYIQPTIFEIDLNENFDQNQRKMVKLDSFID